MTRHKRGVDDWILSTFGNSHPFHEQVSDMLSIVSMGRRYIQCQAFVHEDTVYMTLPAVHGSRPIWAQNEFYTCILSSRHEPQPPLPSPSPPPVSSAGPLFVVDLIYHVTHRKHCLCSMTCLIELAEEKTSCSSLVVVVDPKTKNNLQLNVVLRALMYIGFQLIDSRLYNQNPNYVLAGYEL
ncbi:hypothetical protein BCR43DRAFT_77330 [Syncephalastrum racemosum]|uniref:Uncharacterized protein n=1 Tax=Syncephalastrum racemosum TaxID=13706 RepID=A0A1X2H2Q7_SYNRA|nr:hypothetical protein BCR43DRAFT_77330 [Syncephalastrum racemosum]